MHVNAHETILVGAAMFFRLYLMSPPSPHCASNARCRTDRGQRRSKGAGERQGNVGERSVQRDIVFSEVPFPLPNQAECLRHAFTVVSRIHHHPFLDLPRKRHDGRSNLDGVCPYIQANHRFLIFRHTTAEFRPHQCGDTRKRDGKQRCHQATCSCSASNRSRSSISFRRVKRQLHTASHRTRQDACWAVCHHRGGSRPCHILLKGKDPHFAMLKTCCQVDMVQRGALLRLRPPAWIDRVNVVPLLSFSPCFCRLWCYCRSGSSTSMYPLRGHSGTSGSTRSPTFRIV
ncbi:hypothetical protein DQ04_05941000 [Trypanosoma grayi]|uniref:hypothetical protein n=1 Tax=Trypanosoma grayi TaxID=71804 RepID=UPI0004F4276F|nr:hypothetical protein DQ04_05941000 [Trypanosoma grayi]KEG09034.1 hypothetical protein DQ04_05941000 [Trypanosoma grayi]